MTDPFDAYLVQIQADLQGGKATEHIYHSALEALLEALAQHQSVQRSQARPMRRARFCRRVSLREMIKDRKGRAPSMDDITHDQRIVVALKETLRPMAEIDKIDVTRYLLEK
jgi:hypothetical protein